MVLLDIQFFSCYKTHEICKIIWNQSYFILVNLYFFKGYIESFCYSLTILSFSFKWFFLSQELKLVCHFTLFVLICTYLRELLASILRELRTWSTQCYYTVVIVESWTSHINFNMILIKLLLSVTHGSMNNRLAKWNMTCSREYNVKFRCNVFCVRINAGLYFQQDIHWSSEAEDVLSINIGHTYICWWLTLACVVVTKIPEISVNIWYVSRNFFILLKSAICNWTVAGCSV